MKRWVPLKGHAGGDDVILTSEFDLSTEQFVHCCKYVQRVVDGSPGYRVVQCRVDAVGDGIRLTLKMKKGFGREATFVSPVPVETGKGP